MKNDVSNDISNVSYHSINRTGPSSPSHVVLNCNYSIHHVMIITLMHHLSSVHSNLYHSHSFSHLNALTCLILVIFSSLFNLFSGDMLSIPGPVSRVSSLHMCTLNIRSFTNPVHYTAIADSADTHNIDVFALTETWIFLSLPLLNYLMLFVMVSHLLTQRFFSVNLANFSTNLLLPSNLLNCLQSWSNFLTLIWLYITFIFFRNLRWNLGIMCLFSGSRRLSDSHLIWIIFWWISCHRWLQHLCWWSHWL